MKYILLFVLISCFSCAESTAGIGYDSESKTPSKDMGTKKDFGKKVEDVRKDFTNPKCDPGSSTCLGASKLQRCVQDGTKFEIENCLEGKICSGGECKAPKVCTPGEKKCADTTTLSTCRSNGEAWVAMNCPSGEGCLEGKCVSGKSNGSECSKNEDCASKVCHCGDEEQCGFPEAGICVTKNCTVESCGEGSFCVDGGKTYAGRKPGYDFCLPECAGACALASHECHELPTKTAENKLAYKSACYFKSLAKIGEDCDQASSCGGTLCRTGYFSESDLCTRECDAENPCPLESACVKLDGPYQCIPFCGDGSTTSSAPCPLDLPTDRFDVTCKNSLTATGKIFRVCSKP